MMFANTFSEKKNWSVPYLETIKPRRGIERSETIEIISSANNPIVLW